MERNFETVMIEQCAPVLASLKPAGLFRYETSDCADLARRVRSWNEQLGEKASASASSRAVCRPTGIWCTSTARASSALC